MGSLQEQVSAVARALADSVVPASQAHQQALQSLAGLEWRLAALERCMSQWMQRKPQGAAGACSLVRVHIGLCTALRPCL